MAKEEKKLPDPIEINGIRIGDDRFKINANLDLNRRENTIIGKNSVARSPEDYVYSGNTNGGQVDATAVASGAGSYALGPGAIAQGHYSFAFGSGAHATGNDSFCHGGRGIYGTSEDPISFVGSRSLAQGYGSASFNHSIALADFSFAEGQGITGTMGTGNNSRQPYGTYSHAEGSSNSRGRYSHAEGQNTTSLGRASHSEGENTFAHGESCHSEGMNLTVNFGYNAQGAACHTEGINTIANGYGSHAEGYASEAKGYYNHAQGYFCKAGVNNDSVYQGKYCTALGNASIAAGDQSVASGFKANASYENSLAHGKYIETSCEEQVAIGRINELKDNCAFLVGNGDTYLEDGIRKYNRRNALELTWGGDLHIAGSLYCKGKEFAVPEERLLPKITEKDNNKILSVVNGEWAAISIINAEEVSY